jgi:hypothetical protein
MSATQVLSPVDRTDGVTFDYRPLSVSAIASLIFGALSVLVAVGARSSVESAVVLTPIPLIGLALGIVSLRRMRGRENEFTGAGAAKAGIALSAIFLAGGLLFAGYVHATEVPDGYARTSFAEMKPDEVDLRGGHAIPPDVAALNGKQVFIKGYFRPDSAPFTENVKNFLLVRDNNQCCFGDLSAVQFYDQIAVVMGEGKTVDYSSGIFRMGGKLHIKPENVGGNSGRPVYILEADYAG